MEPTAADGTLRVAVAQVTSGRELDENLELLRRSCDEAAAGGARLVVFPKR